MQVEHHLSSGAFVELLQGQAVGGERRLDRLRDMLHALASVRQRARRDVEQPARARLWNHQHMAIGARHDVHEGERDLVLIDLVRGDFPAQKSWPKILFWGS